MPHRLLSPLMEAACRITQAERAMTLTPDLTVLDRIHLSDEVVQDDAFAELAGEACQRALDEGEPVIMNNMITDPSQAPQTNVSYSNLRVMVAVPIKDVGVIYLDQPIRQGIIDRDTVERIMQMAEQILAEGGYEDTLTAEALIERYRAML